ncbi:MAG: lipopolysaccharide heptosyltransferase family protein, partial [Bacteroidia bacterium]|nr:lipopolysaccharide heptosyltransferase family protein [Bacteroidia bacterium]
MIKLKAVNKYRRKFTQRITKGLSGTHKNKVFNATELPDLKKILLCRPNHRLGNLVLIAPIIQDVAANFPNCKIDLFIKGGLGPVVFKNYTNIETFIELPKKPFKQLLKYVRTWFLIRKKRYDLVINVTSTSSSGRLATKFSKSTFKLFGDENDDQFKNIKDFLHIAKNPVYNFRHCMTALGYDINDNGIPGLDIKLSKTEIKEGQKLLNELVSNKKDTICIFTFATGQKCYDESWWMSF